MPHGLDKGLGPDRLPIRPPGHQFKAAETWFYGLGIGFRPVRGADLGIARGIQLFERVHELFLELPITLTFQGDFLSVHAFLRQLEEMLLRAKALGTSAARPSRPQSEIDRSMNLRVTTGPSDEPEKALVQAVLSADRSLWIGSDYIFAKWPPDHSFGLLVRNCLTATSVYTSWHEGWFDPSRETC